VNPNHHSTNLALPCKKMMVSTQICGEKMDRFEMEVVMLVWLVVYHQTKLIRERSVFR
jgi:hypothetical protein